MKTLVLSISFFVLTVSPFTCTPDVTEVVNSNNQNQPSLLEESDHEEENVEIDPIIMPTKP